MLVILMLLTTSAIADQLPHTLLLKCEVKVTVSITGTGMSPILKEDKFDTTLRLENGSLEDADSIWMSTKHCVLNNGIIRCSAKSIEPSDIDAGSEKRSLDVFLSRDTGEYNLFLETWGYDGRHASGNQTTHEQLRRNGICRAVSKPIF